MNIQVKDLLNAGVHFGHQTQKRNPKMKPYIYTEQGGIHIIDLQKTADCTKKALAFVKSVGEKNGAIVFVGTKKQAVGIVQKAAESCSQFHITKRWLGGTFTNFVTIKNRIDHMRKIDRMREKGDLNYFHKKEKNRIEKQYAKLTSYLGGIRDMKELPKCVFILDMNKEAIAVKEALKLKIPIIALVDTNTDPTHIDFPIPANDDAIKSIDYFCTKIAESYNEGQKSWKLQAQNLEKEKQGEEKQTEEKVVVDERKNFSIKVTKGRQLVAAGTADEVEIEREISSQDETTSESLEDKKDTEKESK